MNTLIFPLIYARDIVGSYKHNIALSCWQSLEQLFLVCRLPKAMGLSTARAEVPSTVMRTVKNENRVISWGPLLFVLQIFIYIGEYCRQDNALLNTCTGIASGPVNYRRDDILPSQRADDVRRTTKQLQPSPYSSLRTRNECRIQIGYEYNNVFKFKDPEWISSTSDIPGIVQQMPCSSLRTRNNRRVQIYQKLYRVQV